MDPFGTTLEKPILAGQRAMRSLDAVMKDLDTAEGWSIADILGGALLISAVKHRYLKEATYKMETAKRDLFLFREALEGADIPINLSLNIGEFMTFADFIFDGFVTDLVVQDKITKAKREILRIQSDVRGVLNSLYAQNRRNTFNGLHKNKPGNQFTR